MLNDKPEVFGRNNRRADSAELFNINAKYFLFSYSTTSKLHIYDGLIPLISTFCDIISINKIDHKKHAMANMSWTNEWLNTTENFEYLVLAKK